jgi:hypothetical protein
LKCLALALALLATVLTGCRLFQKAAAVPGQTWRAMTGGSKTTTDPVAVQQDLMRFTDQFMAWIVVGMDQLRSATNAPELAEVLRLKIAMGTETCSIVSGANSIANLLDMTVFVTATCMTVEENWSTNVYGNAALPLVEGCRNAETQIWQFANSVLKPGQRKELRQAIQVWHKRNPEPEDVLGARTAVLAPLAGGTGTTEAPSSASVFTLLKLDPLSSLDPATRELAQTRLFGDRALFVAQKLPMLLRWQTELLTLNTANLPPVKQLITNTTAISASVERFAAVAEKLPGQISAEREEILKGLQAQEGALTPLVNQMREALAQGSQTSTSLNATLDTFDSVLKRLGVGVTNSATPASTNSHPFNIDDYTQTAVQLEATARRLTELFVTFDQTLGSTNLGRLAAQVSPAVERAQAGGKEVVDYAFRRGLLLVAVVLVIVVLYRLVVARQATAARPRAES